MELLPAAANGYVPRDTQGTDLLAVPPPAVHEGASPRDGGSTGIDPTRKTCCSRRYTATRVRRMAADRAEREVVVVRLGVAVGLDRDAGTLQGVVARQHVAEEAPVAVPEQIGHRHRPVAPVEEVEARVADEVVDGFGEQHRDVHLVVVGAGADRQLGVVLALVGGQPVLERTPARRDVAERA